MARKVGFDQPDTEPKKSIADSYLDEFRKKHNHDLSPNTQAIPQAPIRRRNWIVIIFLSVWLAFWTFGIITVLGIIGSGGAEPFLLIWLAAAGFGWFVVVGILTKQIKGRPAKPKSDK